MRKMVAVLFALMFVCSLSFGGDDPPMTVTGLHIVEETNVIEDRQEEFEFDLSITSLDDDRGDTGELSLNYAIPLGKYFQLGPTLRVTYIDPQDAHSVTSYGVGATLQFNLAEGFSGPVIGVRTLYHLNENEQGVVEPFAGIKMGNVDHFISFLVSRPFTYDTDEDTLIDLERWEASGGIGIRF